MEIRTEKSFNPYLREGIHFISLGLLQTFLILFLLYSFSPYSFSPLFLFYFTPLLLFSLSPYFFSSFFDSQQKFISIQSRVAVNEHRGSPLSGCFLHSYTLPFQALLLSLSQSKGTTSSGIASVVPCFH